MKTRKLRNLEVSEIGYGCMGLSHGYGAVPEKRKSIWLIQLAYDLGCTHFDTAESYTEGANEELVGEALQPIRSRVTIATKLHLLSAENLEQQIESRLDASLKRLRTDYVDLYYQHRNEADVPDEAVAEVMGKLIQKGKIRGWGQSQTSPKEIRRANAVTPLSAIQSEYSMMERMFEKSVIPICEELGIGFVAFSPMASGFLSGKYTDKMQYFGDDVRRVITRFAPENVAANQPLLNMLNHFAAQKQVTPAQISLAWMLHKKDFVVPIPGMRTEERLKENFGASKVELTESEFYEIEAELSKIEIHGNRTDADIKKLHNMAEV
ncbi:MAG: aldo/keto reductase [Clostridiales bacterium]|nr:aldo/keto reductase [Clostridiales bacterium]